MLTKVYVAKDVFPATYTFVIAQYKKKLLIIHRMSFYFDALFPAIAPELHAH